MQSESPSIKTGDTKTAGHSIDALGGFIYGRPLL